MSTIGWFLKVHLSNNSSKSSLYCGWKLYIDIFAVSIIMSRLIRLLNRFYLVTVKLILFYIISTFLYIVNLNYVYGSSHGSFVCRYKWYCSNKSFLVDLSCLNILYNASSPVRYANAYKSIIRYLFLILPSLYLDYRPRSKDLSSSTILNIIIWKFT